MRFTKHEEMLILLYGPDPCTRAGLIEALEVMQKELTGRDRDLSRWTVGLLKKLYAMTDTAFEEMEGWT